MVGIFTTCKGTKDVIFDIQFSPVMVHVKNVLKLNGRYN